MRRTYRARQGYCGTPYAGWTSIEASVSLEVEHYHFVLGKKFKGCWRGLVGRVG